MSSCKVCGEAGHKSSKCSELGPPPEGMYTGEGCGADDDHDHDRAIVTCGRMLLGQNGSMDDEIQSKRQGLVWMVGVFPNILSNGVV
jgi:hypothetical protein